MPGVAGHSRKAQLALLLRRFSELVPLGILEPSEIVDGVIEVYVDVVGLEATQAALECLHNRVPAGVGRSQGLRHQEYILAVATQCVSKRGLRLTAPIGFGSVEIIDAAIDGVAD